MTAAYIDVNVLAGGTVVLSASFEDEDGDSVVPNSLKYSVLDESKEVVNSQQDISISPASSIEVVLSGDNLPAGKLYWVIDGEYDSSVGSNLPLRGYATFIVDKFPEA